MEEVKKYHFHDTGKSSPFTKESHVFNDAYILYEKGENLAAFLLGILQNNPIVYRRIIRVIQSIAPYFNDFYFKASASDTVRLQWTDKFSSTIYGPTDFSDGTIRFIALATLFLQPEPPMSGLIKSAAAKGTQVILATQSCDLISLFEAEDIITVNQENGNTVMNRLDEKELKAWLEDYTLGELWKQNILKGGQPK